MIYINLRGCNSKSDILAAFSAQLALRGIDNNLIIIQESLQRFLRSLRRGSLLLLDHVHSNSTNIVKSLLSSILTTSSKKNKVSVVVIPSMQCTTPILTPGLDTTTNTTTTTSNNTKLPKYYGSSGRRRLALEKELETRSTIQFLTELHTIVTGLGIRWNLHTTNNTTNTSTNNNENNTENPYIYEDIPSNVMLLTYSLSLEETKKLVYKMYNEVITHQRLLLLQNNDNTTTTSTTTNTTDITIENEVVEGICALSGGIPGIIRLLLLQSVDTINYLVKRRNDQITTSSLPSYMSTANTVRTANLSGTAATGMIGNNSPKVKLSTDGTTTGSGSTSSVGVNNPYNGLPSLYSIGWELLQPPALSLSETDRLLLYALSPLLYAHLHIPTDTTTSTKTTTTNPNPTTTSTTIGPKPYATRAYPLSFDTTLAWHLCKPLFTHHITTTGGHNNIQTYTGKHGITPKTEYSIQDEAYNQYILSFNKLISMGWLQVSNTGLPILQKNEKIVYFNNAIIPQYINIKKTLKLVNNNILILYTDTILMNNYIKYITLKYIEISKILLLINKLLITPEAGYISTFLQQRNILLLSTIDNLLLPHFNYLINLIIIKLTIKKENNKKKIINKSRPNIGERGNSKGSSVNMDMSEDEGFDTPGRYRERGGCLFAVYILL